MEQEILLSWSIKRDLQILQYLKNEYDMILKQLLLHLVELKVILHC